MSNVYVNSRIEASGAFRLRFRLDCKLSPRVECLRSKAAMSQTSLQSLSPHYFEKAVYPGKSEKRKQGHTFHHKIRKSSYCSNCWMYLKNIYTSLMIVYDPRTPRLLSTTTPSNLALKKRRFEKSATSSSDFCFGATCWEMNSEKIQHGQMLGHETSFKNVLCSDFWGTRTI